MANNAVLYWIAQNPTIPPLPSDNFDLPGSWLDLTTGKPATAAPDASTTVLFGAGNHIVVGGFAPGDSTAGEVIALPGAAVALASGAPVPANPAWDFGTVVLENGSTLIGPTIEANLVVVGAGATFSPEDGDSHTPFGSTIGELVNNGTLIGSAELTLGLTSTTHPEFVQNSGLPFGYSDSGNSPAYGFAAGESVIPFANGLEINLGNLARGSAQSAMNIAVANYVQGEVARVLSGSGFTADLLPVPSPSGGSTDQIGTFTANTSQLGSHTEVVALTGGGQPTQLLVMTDRVV